MQIDDINNCVRKYLDGETTVEEEQLLRSFFVQEPLLVPDELKPFCALFRWEMQERSAKKADKTAPVATPKQKRIPNWLVAAVSAAAVVVVTMFVVHNNAPQAGDYAIVNGHCTTNREVVQREAETALDMVSTDGSEDFNALSMMGGTNDEQ